MALRFINFGGKSKKANTTPLPKFGRYSDAYKNKFQYERWDMSLLLFERKEYLAAIEALLDFMGDEEVQNVRYEKSADGNLTFELLQGSKIIKGRADSNGVSAEVAVVVAEKLSLPLMRKLMEINFDFRFCRFALHENTICLKYHTFLPDALPDKLYYALREMAINADRYDDLLINEFEGLLSADTPIIAELSAEHKFIKYKYFRLWVEYALGLIKKIDANSQAIPISYLLLNTIYKIDFLLVPQGQLHEKIENINNLFYTESEQSFSERNARAIREFEKLLLLPKEDIYKELYHTKATFGLATHAKPFQVIDAINSILNDLNQFADRRFPELNRLLLEYAAQFTFYHLGMPAVLRDLLKIVIMVSNAGFLAELGYTPILADTEKQLPNAKQIKAELQQIQQEAGKVMPNFSLDINRLKFDSIDEFLHSYLIELSGANFTDKL